MNKRRIIILGLTSLLLCACSNSHSSKPKAVEISYAEALALAKGIKPKIDSYVRDGEKRITTAYYFIGDSLEKREVSTLSDYFLPYERYGDIKVVSSKKNTNLGDNTYYSMDGYCLYSKDQNLGYSNYDIHQRDGDGSTFKNETYYLCKDNNLYILENRGGSKYHFTSPGSGSQPLSDAFRRWQTIDGEWQFSTMNVVVLEYFLIDYLALNDVHRTLSCEKHYYSSGDGNLTIEYKIPYTDKIYLPFLDYHYFGNGSGKEINEVAKCEFRFGFDDYKPALFDFYLKSNADINPIVGSKSDPYETKMKYEFSYEKTNIKQPKLEDYPAWESSEAKSY